MEYLAAMEKQIQIVTLNRNILLCEIVTIFSKFFKDRVSVLKISNKINNYILDVLSDHSNKRLCFLQQ